MGMTEEQTKLVVSKAGDADCAGSIMDCDMSKNWRNLFKDRNTDESKGEKSVSDRFLLS